MAETDGGHGLQITRSRRDRIGQWIVSLTEIFMF